VEAGTYAGALTRKLDTTTLEPGGAHIGVLPIARCIAAGVIFNARFIFYSDDLKNTSLFNSNMEFTQFTGQSLDKVLEKKQNIHVRIQQIRSRRYLTTIQNLDDDLDIKRICRDMRKKFNCNGSVSNDKESGEVIQLQGDQRANVKEWFLANEILREKTLTRLVIHGF
jgi:translation initiation factor 1